MKIVKNSMSDHLITIGWEELMEHAYSRMQANQVRHLAVHNGSGEIIGILSDRDVQRAMISRFESVDGHFMRDESIEFDSDTTVRDYMSWPAKVVDQNTDLRLVAERMVNEKISALLVSRDSKVVGIVTSEDLLKVLISFLDDPAIPSRWKLDHFIHDRNVNPA